MKKYNVEVKVRDGNDWVWRKVHPKSMDPYVFTKEEAEHYVRINGKFDAEGYRIVEAA